MRGLSKTGDGSLSYSDISTALSMHIPGRITRQLVWGVIRPGIFISRACSPGYRGIMSETIVFSRDHLVYQKSCLKWQLFSISVCIFKQIQFFSTSGIIESITDSMILVGSPCCTARQVYIYIVNSRPPNPL